MIDVKRVADEIEGKINELGRGRADLAWRAEKKAAAIAEYDKRVSMVLMGLKNGKSYMLDGEEIKDPPASYSERLARGICWKEKYEAEKAEAEYKNSTVGMDSLMAELNGWQSINRYLEAK